MPDTGGSDRHEFWLPRSSDGTPHLTGVGAVWVDNGFYVVTGEATRMGRSLARDPRCMLGVAARGFDLWSRAKPTSCATLRWSGTSRPVSRPSAGPPP